MTRTGPLFRSLVALALILAPALPAQDGPEGDYFVYVAAESQDEVSLIRFGPGGAEVVETIIVGLYPTEIDGPHGLIVDAAAGRLHREGDAGRLDRLLGNRRTCATAGDQRSL